MVAESTYCKKSAQSFRFFCNFALKKTISQTSTYVSYLSYAYYFHIALSGAGAQPAAAQLTDRTLRIDYQFSGNKQQQHIAVSELLSNKGWAGRTVHLDSLPLKGNGDITLTDKRTGRTLYKQSFSTLFQEWLTTEEATRLSRSFENTFLLPMPVDTAEVTVQLYDFKHRVMTSLRHEVVPSDILIRNLDSHP